MRRCRKLKGYTLLVLATVLGVLAAYAHRGGSVANIFSTRRNQKTI